MSIGLGSEGIWLCPTIDSAAAGTAAATNFGSAGTFTFAGSLGSGHWANETNSGGSRILDFASNRRITVGSNPVTAYPWSFSVWLYPRSSATGSDRTFLGQISTTKLFVLTLVSSVTRVRMYSGGYIAFTSAAVNLNAWNHVAFSAENASSCRCWVNGTLAGSNAGSCVLGSDPQIGGRSDSSGDAFDGYIDDLRIWNDVLTARDIAWLRRNRGVQGPLNWKPGVA